MRPLVASRGIEAGEELLHFAAAAGRAGRAGDVSISQEQFVDLAAGAAAEIVKRHILPGLLYSVTGYSTDNSICS